MVSSSLLLGLVASVYVLFRRGLHVFASLSSLVSIVYMPYATLVCGSTLHYRVGGVSLFKGTNSRRGVGFYLFGQQDRLVLRGFSSNIISRRLATLFRYLCSTSVRTSE